MSARGGSIRAWIARRVEAALTQTRTLHGIPVQVLNQRADIDTAELFERTDAALALIAESDPRRFRRLARDLHVIQVRRGFTRGAYYHDGRRCVLDNTFVANPAFAPVEIAACIVHEAMHARIACMGVKRRPEQLPREERMCRRAEVAFAERAPGGERVLARAAPALELADDDVAPSIDYAEVQRRVLAADLAAMQAPRWLKRWIARRNGIALPE